MIHRAPRASIPCLARPRDARMAMISCRVLAAVAVASGGLTGCGSEVDSADQSDVTSFGDNLSIGASGSQVEAVYQYYRNYGYFPNDELQRSYPAWRPLVSTPPSRTDLFDAHMEDATRLFQRNVGLPQTGVVDGATRAILAQPRCGVPDGIPAIEPGNKWNISGRALGQVEPDMEAYWICQRRLG